MIHERRVLRPQSLPGQKRSLELPQRSVDHDIVPTSSARVVDVVDRWHRLNGGVNKRRSVDGSNEKLRLTKEESTQSDRRDVD